MGQQLLLAGGAPIDITARQPQQSGASALVRHQHQLPQAPIGPPAGVIAGGFTEVLGYQIIPLRSVELESGAWGLEIAPTTFRVSNYFGFPKPISEASPTFNSRKSPCTNA